MSGFQYNPKNLTLAEIEALLASYVPYTGATANVNLGAFSITAPVFKNSSAKLYDGGFGGFNLTGLNSGDWGVLRMYPNTSGASSMEFYGNDPETSGFSDYFRMRWDAGFSDPTGFTFISEAAGAYSEGYISFVFGSSGTVLQLTPQGVVPSLILDNALFSSINSQTRQLFDFVGSLSVDYGNHQLYDLAGTNVILNFANAAMVVLGSAYAQNGALWYDATQKAHQVCSDDAYQTLMGTLFSQTATGTAANTAAETTISSTGIGTLTLPPTFLIAGKTIRIKASGIHGATASPTLNIKIKFGSTVIVSTGAIATGNSTNEGWELELDITCRTAGVSGTVMAGGSYVENATTPRSFGMVNTGTVTVNTNASQAITLTAQFSAANASNTISCQILTVEVLN